MPKPLKLFFTTFKRVLQNDNESYECNDDNGDDVVIVMTQNQTNTVVISSKYILVKKK